MEVVISTILSYLVGLAVNYRTSSIMSHREKKLKQQLAHEENLRKALASSRSLRDELRTSCVELARDLHRLGVPEQEKPLWALLTNDKFQDDLTEWLMAGGIREGDEVKERLVQAMETALTQANVHPEQVAFLKDGYFETLEKAIFTNATLAHWRHQLSLNYLREQVIVLRRHSEEAAGIYSLEKQKATLERYCEKALETWDIIDLSTLPEGDIHMATQQLLLRQLYMPLRIMVEPKKPDENEDSMLARFEELREHRRRLEAGHLNIDNFEHPLYKKSRAPIGERLAISRRLVVLGDPGGGKTTMLRWMATAYLLQIKKDDAFYKIPDAETLPKQPWIPVLIRCRDLGKDDLCRSFKDFLTQHLNKTKLLPDEANVMLAVILDRLAKGEVLLLIDGLDEITDPHVRVIFCQELEHIAARYPDAAIVVTSRIVGYRDMPYRISSGFEHGIIAELDRNDKDLFAHRWIEVTEQKQSPDEKAKRVEELQGALHSSNRIERLTGNPMLLTTMALVKRKVGKLPSKRTKLYAEAVSVLLNWNPRFYETIEEDEAIPQLEYLAYEMCRRGVQKLTDDEVLDLLDKLRTEYRNIRAVRRREPHEFLAHLEARSSILIKSGDVWQKNEAQGKPVWEFRHLTFQEYLAARALLDGRYPDRDKSISLAEQVAPLAGTLEVAEDFHPSPELEREADIPESWREALRLLVADCKDDDVDDALLAIMTPLTGEDAVKTKRPRAVLAALCLADEPNIDEQTAQEVIKAFVGVISPGDGNGASTVDKAAIDISASLWAPLLKSSLIKEYCCSSPDKRVHSGALLATLEGEELRRSGLDPQAQLEVLVKRLESDDLSEVLAGTLATMQAAFERKIINSNELIQKLFKLLNKGKVECHAASWALNWLSGGWRSASDSTWLPTETELDTLIKILNESPKDESDQKCYLIQIIKKTSSQKTHITLISQLNDQSPRVRKDVIEALGEIGNKLSVTPLLDKLDDEDPEVHIAVIEALGQIGDTRAVTPLLDKLDYQDKNICMAIIEALGEIGDTRAVTPLLDKLDDPDSHIHISMNIIEALGKIGDTRAVTPLLEKLDNQGINIHISMNIIGALGQIGDTRAVTPLLDKLDDPDVNVRMAIIRTLGQIGDKQAEEPLIQLLQDENPRISIVAASALAALGVSQGPSTLKEFLETGKSSSIREFALHELLKARNEPNEKILLSYDLDGFFPFRDLKEPITETCIAAAAEKLRISPQEARSLYESIAADFCLSFT